MTLKICTNCKEEKFLIEFSKKWNTPDGLQRQCRQCHSNIHKLLKEKLP